MKKNNLFKVIAILLVVPVMLSLYACGKKKADEVSSSEKSALTPKQQVEKLLLEEFANNYGDNMEKCEFREIKIYTPEEIAENEVMFYECHFEDTDIVFSATYDLKAPDGKDILPLLPANGEEDGQWVRNKYICGYLSLVSEGVYELASAGTAF